MISTALRALRCMSLLDSPRRSVQHPAFACCAPTTQPRRHQGPLPRRLRGEKAVTTCKSECRNNNAARSVSAFARECRHHTSARLGITWLAINATSGRQNLFVEIGIPTSNASGHAALESVTKLKHCMCSSSCFLPLPPLQPSQWLARNRPHRQRLRLVGS